MRIGLGKTMSGKMLTAIGHASQRQSVIKALGEQGDHARIAMESPIADHFGLTVIEVQHGSE